MQNIILKHLLFSEVKKIASFHLKWLSGEW